MSAYFLGERHLIGVLLRFLLFSGIVLVSLMFQVGPAPQQSGSTAVIKNRAFRDWGKIFVDNTLAAAMIDGLMRTGGKILIEGDSYRTDDSNDRPGRDAPRQ